MFSFFEKLKMIKLVLFIKTSRSTRKIKNENMTCSLTEYNFIDAYNIKLFKESNNIHLGK